MRNLPGPVVLALSLAVSGCAAGHGGALTTRLVRPGESGVAQRGTAADAGDSLQDFIGKVRHVSAAATPRQRTLAATIESSDAGLAAALLVEAAAPTARNHLRVAEEYRRLRILDSAHARLNLALRKEPRFAEAHEAMARVWRDWGMPELGLSAAHRATYFKPRSASAQNTLGTLLDALGDSLKARDAYRRAAALNGSAAWAVNNLCYLEFRLGRLDAARIQCQEALRRVPMFVAAHNNLALIYAAAGDLENAQREFRAAGNIAAADYNLGIVHLADGEYALAAVSFERAIQAEPTFTAAKERAHATRMRLMKGSE